MCTRFYINISDKELREIVRAAQASPLAEQFTLAGESMTASGGEIFPTNVVPVIASSKSGKKTVFPMKWGYALRGKDGKVSTILNARSETAGRKPTFWDSWRQHRCIIPASYYFEWEHVTNQDRRRALDVGSVMDQTLRSEKIKYAIQPNGSEVTWLCGLYHIEDGLPHFVVLTREPGEGIRFIHDRMPLILPKDRIDAWIDPSVPAEKIVPDALTEMVFERAK
jgi:putative SOS response-associated peptidase YedK